MVVWDFGHQQYLGAFFFIKTELVSIFKKVAQNLGFNKPIKARGPIILVSPFFFCVQEVVLDTKLSNAWSVVKN